MASTSETSIQLCTNSNTHTQTCSHLFKFTGMHSNTGCNLVFDTRNLSSIIIVHLSSSSTGCDGGRLFVCHNRFRADTVDWDWNRLAFLMDRRSFVSHIVKMRAFASIANVILLQMYRIFAARIQKHHHNILLLCGWCYGFCCECFLSFILWYRTTNWGVIAIHEEESLFNSFTVEWTEMEKNASGL